MIMRNDPGPRAPTKPWTRQLSGRDKGLLLMATIALAPVLLVAILKLALSF